MKPMLCMLLMIILLFGCAVKEKEAVFETVADEVLPASAQENVQFVLALTLPDGTLARAETAESGAVLVQKAEGYTLTAETVEAESLDAALRKLTGFSQENLRLLPLRLSPQQVYGLSWCAAEEDGIYLSRAALLVQDGSYYLLRAKYAEGASGSMDAEIDAILRSVCLLTADGSADAESG